MATIIFLRHAHSQANERDILAGRMSGIGLSLKGIQQAEDLISRIGATEVDHLYMSPMERCQLTISPWLKSEYSSRLITSEIADAFNEVDYGSWSGLSLKKLRKDPLWSEIQSKPSHVKFPEGESIKKAQIRAVRGVEGLIKKKSKKIHLVVTHSDLIKVMVTYFLGNKLDHFQQLAIDPATFTVMRGEIDRLDLITLNSRDSLERILA